MQNMGESLYTKIRANERFNTALNATYSIKGRYMQYQECRITNLSSSGAKVRLPQTKNLRSGTAILIDIHIPNTIMRIATEAEIMWIKQRYNRLISGIKFTGTISDGMIQQLVKMNPEVSLAFQ